MSDSQAQILQFCLKNCVFDGWNTELLEKACQNAGLDKHYWRIIFPNGVTDVVAYFVQDTNQKMAEHLKGSNLRTTEKIRSAIKYRLDINHQYKPQIRSMISLGLLHPIREIKTTYDIVDTMWRAAGDTSTDWNFYTKRGLLAAVYSSTLLYWLDDKSDNSEATWEFLDRRLAEVGKFNKGMSKIKAWLPKLAS